METKFSLIIATFGRVDELESLLASLNSQTISKDAFEVIIVDQNPGSVIHQLVKNFSVKFTIRYFQSQRQGLSYNRNLGITHAKGSYLAFPDDDCEYYPDTLASIDEALQNSGFPDMIIGKVYDRTLQKYVFKKTPDNQLEINAWNFYPMVSSITLIIKNNGVRFDENFGIGERYYSNEDGDMILQFLHRKLKVIYSPRIEFNHPPYSASTMSLDKVYRYGIGFGAMCRKHISLPVLYLYCKVILFQILMSLKELMMLNPKSARRRFYALKGRLAGFFMYQPV